MQRTRAAFKAWDTNGDGVLDFKEIMCGCLGAGMDPEEVSGLFAAMDVDGDGSISLEEWVSGSAAYRRAAHDAVVATPGKSRLTTGVTLAFLRDLPSVIAKLDGGAFPQALTTEQLVFGQSSRNATGPGPIDWCIAGVTAEHKCCLIEWCERAGLTQSSSGSPYFAPVTHFVSHAWHASFPQLVATLELYAAGDDGMGSGVPAETAAWFLDVFLINQHCPPWCETPPRPPDQVLKPPIAACGRCVLVLQPWEKPTSFTRVWCLFEIMTTLNEGATLDVALSAGERDRFVETLVEEYDNIMANISAIDARKATATVLKDRDDIFALIKKADTAGGGTGFDGLNEAVMGAIRGWMVEAALDNLAGVGRSVQGFEHKEVVAHAADSLRAALLLPIGKLYESQGRYKEALEAYGRALALRRKAPGEEDLESARSLSGMAHVYKIQGRKEEALELYGRVLAVNRKEYGEEHPNTAAVLNNMAGVYDNLGRYDEALKAYGRALAMMRKALGEDHPMTAPMLDNMAGVYVRRFRYEEALEAYGRSLVLTRKAYGEEHPNTAFTLFGMAGAYMGKFRHKEALELYVRVLAVRRKVLGEAHPDTGATHHALAMVYLNLSRLKESASSFMSAATVYAQAYGMEHTETEYMLEMTAKVQALIK